MGLIRNKVNFAIDHNLFGVYLDNLDADLECGENAPMLTLINSILIVPDPVPNPHLSTTPSNQSQPITLRPPIAIDGFIDVSNKRFLFH